MGKKHKITIELEELFKQAYPRRQPKTMKKIVGRIKGRVNNWNKKYGVDKQWCYDNIFDIFKNKRKCKYCNEELLLDDISLDRKTAENLGGKNVKSNFQFIHHRCNTRKGQLDDEAYTSLVELISTWIKPMQTYIYRKLSRGEY